MDDASESGASASSASGLNTQRVLILGAAGRDFHDYNVAFRHDPLVEVVGFTAAQIPGIDARRYPAELAGPRHPEGLPIWPEDELEARIAEHQIDRVVFAYSDVSHEHVMHLASRVLAAGADFQLTGPRRTMLRSARPVIAVSAVRTGCGKSQTARFIAGRLREAGLRVAAIRHPMPYGDLVAQAVQRFADRADLDRAACTVEEREEYEPYLEAGGVVFAGVDYARILEAAEKEADVILWDGGNNDFPFVRPDLHLVLVDALRPGHVGHHHPGEATLRMADLVVIAKSDVASPAQVQQARDEVRRILPEVPLLLGASPVTLDDPGRVQGRRVVVVDDGPTLTHGGMSFGAGFRAALDAGAEVVDPWANADPALLDVRRAYPHLDRVLPAMGYGAAQLEALGRTLAACDADVIVAGTPVDLAALLDVPQPIVRARYRYADRGEPGLGGIIDRFVNETVEGGGSS